MDKSTVALILSSIGIVLAIIAIAISIYIFIKNKELTLTIHAQNQQSKRLDRITTIVTEYFRLSDRGKSNGIMGLIQAGISTLQDEAEAKEVISSITNRIHNNPLGDHRITIEEVGILKLFQHIDATQFAQGRLGQIIEKLKRD